MQILFMFIILFFMLLALFGLLSLLIATVFGSPIVWSRLTSVQKSFDLAGLKKGETVLDLGCGNGRNLILAVQKYGAKGIGVDRSLYCYILAKIKVFLSGESHNIQIIWGDFKKAEKLLSQVDVVYLYLLTTTMAQIEDWFFDHLGKETRAVSLAFLFPNHTPVKEIPIVNLGYDSKIRLYRK